MNGTKIKTNEREEEVTEGGEGEGGRHRQYI